MRTEVMEVLLSFIIKNIEGYADRKIQKDFPEDMLFIDVLRELLKIIESNITLDKIAVISSVKGLFSYNCKRNCCYAFIRIYNYEKRFGKWLQFNAQRRNLQTRRTLLQRC